MLLRLGQMLKEHYLEIVLKILEFGRMLNLHLLHQHGYISIKDLFRRHVSVGGFPQVKRGSVGMYTLIAQDDLNTLGFPTGGLDGIFGANTENAVRRYQTSRGLASDGIVGCNTWRSLQENVVGTGRTSTTID